MSFIKDLRIISLARKPGGLMAKHLPVRSQVNKFNWFYREPAQQKKLTLWQGAFESTENTSSDDVMALKVSRGRRVLRVKHGDATVIVKGFSYADSWGKQLYRHRLYAEDEALGLMLAADRGISVPKVMAYGEQRLGIRKLASMVVMEDVKDAFHPVDIFRGNQTYGMSVEGVLLRVTPLMRQLYEAGCHHIDVHGTSFLIHETDASQDKVIDFQFAVFHERPSGRILAQQLAHFSRASFKDLDAGLLDDWASSVISEIEPSNSEALFRIYQECSRKPVGSTFRRMALKP